MAIETAKPMLEAKQHEFRISLPAREVLLDVDPLRISQALSNLLTNAAKYTDNGGRIVLDASLSADGLRLRVADSGIGIHAEALPRLFEMFSQVDSAIDRSEGGLGIGLALVRGLVELHGGEVTVASDGLGHGTVFAVVLPAALVAHNPAEREARLYAARMPGALRHRILIVDDNHDAADALALVFSGAGYDTRVAYSGVEALAVGRREWPSIVMLDIGMPGMNGYEVVTRMRQESWGSCALVIAVSGWGQAEDRQRALAAGFDRHMTKPVEFRDVERVIGQLFAGGRNDDEDRRAVSTTAMS